MRLPWGSRGCRVGWWWIPPSHEVGILVVTVAMVSVPSEMNCVVVSNWIVLRM